MLVTTKLVSTTVVLTLALGLSVSAASNAIEKGREVLDQGITVQEKYLAQLCEVGALDDSVDTTDVSVNCQRVLDGEPYFTDAERAELQQQYDSGVAQILDDPTLAPAE